MYVTVYSALGIDVTDFGRKYPKPHLFSRGFLHPLPLLFPSTMMLKV